MIMIMKMIALHEEKEVKYGEYAYCCLLSVTLYGI